MVCILTSIIRHWLGKIWVCSLRCSTHKTGRDTGHTVLGKLYFIAESVTSRSILLFYLISRFHFLLWKDSIPLHETFIRKWHACFLPRPLSLCFHSPCPPTDPKTGSSKQLQLTNWVIARYPRRRSASPSGTPRTDTNADTRTSEMSLLLFCNISALTLWEGGLLTKVWIFSLPLI